MSKTSTQTKKVLLLLSLTVLVVAIPKVAFAEATFVQNLLLTFVSGVFGTIFGISGLVLDNAIGTFVVGFGELYESSGLGFSINNLWSTVRDMFNLTFIFGLVYIGFKMIFNSSDSNARKMLGSLVIAALLVNFSLFITKFVIDFSNIAATQLAAGFEEPPLNSGVYDVSTKFNTIMGITTVLKTGEELNAEDGAIYAYIFGSLILYLVATFVFAAGGILLIIRFVVLNIYMVLSPLMFLGWVFPGFMNVSKEYWSGFMSRAFFAPAYILMLYFSYQILVNMQGVLTAGSKGFGVALLEPNVKNFVSIIPYFILSASFLVASLVIANKMGTVGASNAIAIGKRVSGRARQYATNTATYLPRVAARKATNAAGDTFTKKFNTLQTGKGWGGAIARTNVVDKATRGTLTAASGAKFGTGTTNQANKDYATKTQARVNQTETELGRKNTLESTTATLSDTSASAKDLGTALDDLAKTMKQMSQPEKEGLKFDQLIDKNVAAHLSEADLDNFQKSGKFNIDQVKQIRQARQSGIIATAVGGSTLAKVIPPPAGSAAGTASTVTYDNPNIAPTDANGAQKLDAQVDKRASFTPIINREAKDMPIEIFRDKEMRPYITPEMIEELIKNGKLSNPADQKAIQANIQAYVNEQSTPDNMRAKWKRWGDNTTLGAGFGITVEARNTATNSSTTPPSTPFPTIPTV